MTRCRSAAALLLVAGTLSAQFRPLSYVRDTAISLDAFAIRTVPTFLVRHDGGIVIAPASFYGDLIAIDSTGKKLPWKVSIGRGRDVEVSWVGKWGLVGDSIWILDPGYRQLAVIGTDGKVASSIGFPSWIRPFWRDRRKYPLFANGTWEAVLDDGSLLVVPTLPRHLFDTPLYDRSQKLLVRVDKDGRILNTVASLPVVEGSLQFRDGRERKTFNIPNFARTAFKTSPDGERVVVLAPLPHDSGAFRVTALSRTGDTLYSRRYQWSAPRVSRAAVDSFLASITPFYRYSAERIRDTISKHVATFHSPIGALNVGVDHSAWIFLRVPEWDPQIYTWLVTDSLGEPVGIASLPRTQKITAYSIDRLWAVEAAKGRTSASIVLLRRESPTAARPSRSGRTSASPPPARPRG